uniref:Uncharacterized protein n=1 Tax=Anguilla anguilla TaxID=7936 RepID=A0A0E9RDA4_ANGAN
MWEERMQNRSYLSVVKHLQSLLNGDARYILQ